MTVATASKPAATDAIARSTSYSARATKSTALISLKCRKSVAAIASRAFRTRRTLLPV